LLYSKLQNLNLEIYLLINNVVIAFVNCFRKKMCNKYNILKILKIFLNLSTSFEQVINNYFDIFDTLPLEIDHLTLHFTFN